MENVDKVRAKIAALLAKTEAAGATESEAAAAMAIAAKLMDEHGVTMDDLKSGDKNTHEFVSRKFNDGKKLSTIDKWVATAIAFYTDTKVWNQKEFTGFKDGVTHLGNARMKTESNLMFYGYAVDVELAEYIYKVCNIALETEWKLFSTRIPQGSRKQVRSSFLIGMASRLAARLRDMKGDHTKKATITDLVVLKRQLVESSFAEQVNTKLKKPYGGSQMRNFLHSAFEAGKDAGDKVRFHREVYDGPSKGVKLIA